MKNGKYIQRARKRPSMIAQMLMGAVTLGAAALVIRSIPDLVRYLRVRRM